MKAYPAGYQLIDMQNIDLTPASGVTVPGVYERVQKSNGKLLLLWNVKLGATVYPNAMAVYNTGSSIVLPGLGSFTVTSADKITYTVAS